MGPGWSGLVPCTSQSCESNKRVYTGLKDLRDCHQLLRDTGLAETGEAADIAVDHQGPKPAVSLVALGDLPSTWAASQDDFPTPRQLCRHLSRYSGPAASLRNLPAGDQLPPMVAAQARGRAAGQISYATGLSAGTTWGRDQHGASLDQTRMLHSGRWPPCSTSGCPRRRASDVTSSGPSSANGQA